METMIFHKPRRVIGDELRWEILKTMPYYPPPVRTHLDFRQKHNL